MQSIKEIEGQRGALRILLYLLKEGRAMTTELMSGVGLTSSTMYRALNLLQNLNLVEKEIEKKPTIVVWIKLTDKGRLVAKHLEAIDQILERE